MKFSGRLDENIREIKERFTDCGDIISRCLNVGEKRLFLVYVDSMIDRGGRRIYQKYDVWH